VSPVAERPFAVARGGMHLSVRLVPKAAASRIIGLVATEAGTALKISVHAPPVDGRANEALLRLLAETLALPRRDFSLAQGAGDRRKLVHISGDPLRLKPQLEEALLPWLKPA
jgi:uncharacterized protein